MTLQLARQARNGYNINTYQECARDKLDDRTAPCPGADRRRKVLTLDRWVKCNSMDLCSTRRWRWVLFAYNSSS